MKVLRIVTTAVFCVALIGSIVAPSAKADTWDKKTVVTFSAPVATPGVHRPGHAVLPAGTYVFRLLDSQSNRHIVQIFSEDESIVYATVLAIPNYRLKATDKTVITFSERPAGQPEALRAWFYPGANFGEEFVYPKVTAMELAKATNQPVLFTPTEFVAKEVEPIKAADEPQVLQLQRLPVMTIKPSGEQVELAQAAPAPAPSREPEAAQEPAPASRQVAQNLPPTLPDTGSPLPLTALFGMLALGGASLLRFAQKRIL
jgi:LPXTG-motif cell wall-anchored protein